MADAQRPRCSRRLHPHPVPQFPWAAGGVFSLVFTAFLDFLVHFFPKKPEGIFCVTHGGGAGQGWGAGEGLVVSSVLIDLKAFLSKK